MGCGYSRGFTINRNPAPVPKHDIEASPLAIIIFLIFGYSIYYIIAYIILQIKNKTTTGIRNICDKENKNNIPLPNVIKKIIDLAEQQIDLNNQGIMDDQIEELVSYINDKSSKRYNLILFNNNLTDKCLEHFSKLTNVRSINLAHNNISGTNISFLCSNPTIESIDLTYNPLTKAALKQLAESSKQKYR
jgi:hypothetical protein